LTDTVAAAVVGLDTMTLVVVRGDPQVVVVAVRRADLRGERLSAVGRLRQNCTFST
jgi:hypothetical protein